MKNFNVVALLFGLFCLTSCIDEDPGPRQSDSRTYLVDFDRVEAGDALIVNIQQGNNYSIQADGDCRNLDDLMVYKNENTLVLHFSNYDIRQYSTTLNITLPALVGCNFSGAVNARLSGFPRVDKVDLALSGSSLAQWDVETGELHFSLSGASQLLLKGEGQILQGTISGASILSAFDYGSTEVKLLVSGASNAKVRASRSLYVNATGASSVLYRGNPQLIVKASGASTVRQE